MLLGGTGGQVLVHQRVDQAFIVGMAFVAEHGVAAQDAVLERIEANDFVGLGAGACNKLGRCIARSGGMWVNGSCGHHRFLGV